MQDILAYTIVFCVCIFPLIWVHHEKEKYFQKKFREFNHNRVNPLSEQSFESYFRLEHTPIAFGLNYLGTWDIKTANHRSGDELIENPSRDAKERIKNHLKLDGKNTSSIISLGYHFKSYDNFIPFVKLLSSLLEDNTSVGLPVNNEWFIIQKREGRYAISFKPNSFKN